jgi:hypothetical protein
MLNEGPDAVSLAIGHTFESRGPDFLTPAHLDVIKVLSSQVTVALRNAQLYRECRSLSLCWKSAAGQADDRADQG